VTRRLTYSAVTPARNEAANLQRLGESMATQSVQPEQWVIVDNGSSDESPEVISQLLERLAFASAISVPNVAPSTARGRPIVAAFQAGAASLEAEPDVVVKLDADVSFDPDYFERLLHAFSENDRLGIASGTCYEQDEKGEWRATYTTRDHVRGATRAYRSECFRSVTPLEERMGWDGIDELRAQVAGWQTASIPDVRFYHHRPLGARERAWSKWVGQGDMAHYMGYRFTYLLARTGYRMIREPSAAGMVWGYFGAVLDRRERYADPQVREHLRRQQSISALPQRIGEALGRTNRS
jgi:glycosyltransferase involved in cell wall biosynthesis